jgi:hypothetical protein
VSADDPAPRGAIPNWQPATTVDDYLRNVREGLEPWSERRFAKLAGVTRKFIWQAKLWASLPEKLFEQLLAHRVGTKAMIAVALTFQRDKPSGEVERCPHCGEVLRIRSITGKARDAIKAWLAEVEDGPQQK